MLTKHDCLQGRRIAVDGGEVLSLQTLDALALFSDTPFNIMNHMAQNIINFSHKIWLIRAVAGTVLYLRKIMAAFVKKEEDDKMDKTDCALGLVQHISDCALGLHFNTPESSLTTQKVGLIGLVSSLIQLWRKRQVRC